MRLDDQVSARIFQQWARSKAIDQELSARELLSSNLPIELQDMDTINFTTVRRLLEVYQVLLSEQELR